MDLNRRSKDKSKERPTTLIFEGLKMNGDIKGAHNLILNGELEGKIDLDALLTIGKTGKVNGEIRAENVIVEGEIIGTLEAKEKVEIRDNGKYKGDIVSPSVMVSDKAFFQGNVKMDGEGKESNVQQFTEKREKGSFEE